MVYDVIVGVSNVYISLYYQYECSTHLFLEILPQEMLGLYISQDTTTKDAVSMCSPDGKGKR
jgi:hypothetical protein